MGQSTSSPASTATPTQPPSANNTNNSLQRQQHPQYYQTQQHPQPMQLSSSSSSSLTEPPDAPDHIISHGHTHTHIPDTTTSTPSSSSSSSLPLPASSHQSNYPIDSSQDPDDLIDPNDVIGESVSPISIPASGRGNSEDGHQWYNPSANQLYRALKRKEKPIAKEDALAVSTVHNAVTENTWNAILEYERLHSKKCPHPTLARFQGMDGIYSMKAKFVNILTAGQLPFDRHDWYVDRCGKEIKYIIDYYSVEERDPLTGDMEVAYYIDARPSPATLSGIYDRIRLATQKYRRGESIW